MAAQLSATTEIALEGKATSPDDSREVANLRRKLAADIEDIKRRGGIVHIPPE